MIQLFKTTVLASSLILLSFTPSPQGDIDTQYASKEGVTAFSFSKDMIDALDFDMDVNDKMKCIKGDLSSIKFLAFNDDNETNSLKLLQDLNKSGYENIEWDGVDSDIDVLLYVDRNGKPKAMISFYGDITVKDDK